MLRYLVDQAMLRYLVDQAMLRYLVDQAMLRYLVDQAMLRYLVDQAMLRYLVDQAMLKDPKDGVCPLWKYNVTFLPKQWEWTELNIYYHLKWLQICLISWTFLKAMIIFIYNQYDTDIYQ